MASFILQRTGNPPLKFEGELIAESRPQPVANKKEPNRWHELAVFRTAAGKYVLAVTYRAEWKDEQSHSHAEVHSDSESVVAALRQYNPIAHVRGFPLGEAFAHKQQRLLQEISQRFATQVSELLNRDEFAEVIE